MKQNIPIKSIDYNNISTGDPILRKAMYKAFYGKCFYTGQKIKFEDMHIDHVHPKSKGGKNSIYNYVMSSRRINLAKNANYNGKTINNILYLIQCTYAPKVKHYIRKELKKKKEELKKQIFYQESRPAHCFNYIQKPAHLLDISFVKKKDYYRTNKNKKDIVEIIEWAISLSRKAYHIKFVNPSDETIKKIMNCVDIFSVKTHCSIIANIPVVKKHPRLKSIFPIHVVFCVKWLQLIGIYHEDINETIIIKPINDITVKDIKETILATWKQKEISTLDIQKIISSAFTC